MGSARKQVVAKDDDRGREVCCTFQDKLSLIESSDFKFYRFTPSPILHFLWICNIFFFQLANNTSLVLNCSKSLKITNSLIGKPDKIIQPRGETRTSPPTSI